MLKVKALGAIVEFDENLNPNTEDEAVSTKLVAAWGTKVDTSQGMVDAGSLNTLSVMVLMDLVDPDFEIVEGDADDRLVKRLVQEGDVLTMDDED